MNKKRAFTLVEVMVAIALSCIVLVAIYNVWLKVTREINKSHAKQALQNELRTAANYMQKDFKSIKTDTFEIENQNDEGSSVRLSFEVFKEGESDKLAQESTAKIEYKLLNNLLTRQENGIEKILSVHIDSFSIARAENDEATGISSLVSEDFKAGREAKLDITLTAKCPVYGVPQGVWHVEKTSVVMRQEYYKSVNKTFVSNFELAQKELNDVIVKDTEADASFQYGKALSEEYLKSLDDDQLDGMLKAQEDMLKQVKESLKDMNDGIKGTETGENAWQRFIANLTGSEGAKVRDLRSRLAKADSIEACEDIIKKLEQYTKDKEDSFLGESLKAANINFDSLSAEQKNIYKEAYNMKLTDRNLKGAYDAQIKDGKDIEKPNYMIDTYKGVANGKQQEVKDSDNKIINLESGSSAAATSQRRQDVIKAYETLDLAWMGEFGKERKDIGIYNAAQSLINQGKSKIDVLDMRNTTNENIDKIKKVQGGRP